MAENNFIELNDLNDIEFINNKRNKFFLDSLIGDTINTTFETLITLIIYRKILDSIK